MTRKKGKIIQRSVREELFGASVHLVMSEWSDLLPSAKIMVSEEKFDQLKEVIEKHGKDSYCAASCIGLGGGSSLIWANPGASVSDLIHEIVHAAINLLRDRGIPLGQDSEEVYAYLIEFLFTGLSK